jgi:hypothetical protein
VEEGKKEQEKASPSKEDKDTHTHTHTQVSSPLTYHLLAKKSGNKHNYDHTSMLLHKDCEKDHFPVVLKWVLEHE